MTSNSRYRIDPVIFAAQSLATAIVAMAIAVMMMPHANAQGAGRGGEEVVKSVCAKCHEAGANGAPRIGDRDAWVPRISQGLDHAVASAIHGHNAMPARGGTAYLTDGEMRSAIVYMVNPAYAQAARAVMTGAASPPAKTVANHKAVGAFDVYIGFASADAVARLAKDSPEYKMHGGVPRGSGYQHVNVTVFDRATMIPIPDARVEAIVEEVGLTSESKKLEPMTPVAGSYGNYFRMAEKTPYRIRVRISTPETTRTTEALFERGPS